MKQILQNLHGFFGHLPDLLKSNKKITWALIVFTLIAVGSGSYRVKYDMSMESFFQKGDRTKEIYDLFRYTFQSDESVYLVYEAKDGDVLSEASLKALSSLHKDLIEASYDQKEENPLRHITDVKSLINASYLEVEGDLLRSRDFVGEEIPETEADREKLRKQAMDHPDYPEFYISKDSKLGSVIIETDLGTEILGADLDEDSQSLGGFDSITPTEPKTEDAIPTYKAVDNQDYTYFWLAVEKILEKDEYQKHFVFHPVGNPVLMSFLWTDVMSQINYLFLGMFVLMFIVLWFLFRSFSAIIWPLVIVLLSSLLIFGIVGWLGISMNTMVSVLFLLMITAGIADSLHIISGYLYFRRKGEDPDRAICSTMEKSGVACLLTSVTTAVGLCSLIFVPIQPIQNFGISAALGVMLAFLATVVLLPLFLDIWSPAGPKAEFKDLSGYAVQRLIGKMEPIGKNNPKTVVVVFGILALVFVYGLFQVKVDSNILEVIREGYGFKENYKLVDEKMGGTQNLEIFMDAKKQDAFKDPEVLMRMDELQDYMENHPSQLVVSTNSIVDIVKFTYKVLNQNKQEMYKIPEDRRTLVQTLFLFDNTNPEDRVKIVPDDYGRARISARMYNAGSSDYVSFFDDVKAKAVELFDPIKADYPQMEVMVTGGVALLMRMSEHISWSQVKSFALALGVVSLILLIVFGSIKVGIFSVLPNIFPIMVTFGLMGYLGIPLDTDTLIIAPIIIGISVDDTIHYMSHYRSEYLKTGNIGQSIENTLKEVGQAITFTSLVLVVGFAVMIPSVHMGLAAMGFLSGVAFIAAWLGDMILLPALCVLGRVRFKNA